MRVFFAPTTQCVSEPSTIWARRYFRPLASRSLAGGGWQGYETINSWAPEETSARHLLASKLDDFGGTTNLRECVIWRNTLGAPEISIQLMIIIQAAQTAFEHEGAHCGDCK